MLVVKVDLGGNEHLQDIGFILRHLRGRREAAGGEAVRGVGQRAFNAFGMKNTKMTVAKEFCFVREIDRHFFARVV